MQITPALIRVSATTNIFLVVKGAFGTSTLGAEGYIMARRRVNKGVIIMATSVTKGQDSYKKDSSPRGLNHRDKGSPAKPISTAN